MYPMAMDQSRQDNIPTQHTLQVHMHHLCCPCSNVMYPYYPPGYRPPILAQPPPIPRPSYLHHYQYTQLHVNPTYNVPITTNMTQPLPQSLNHSPPSTVDLAFGPPPRDRRTLDNQDYDEQRTIFDKNKNEIRDALQYTSLTHENAYVGMASNHSNDNYMNLTATQVASLSTENYIAYLVNGCVTGEKIAKRNEHRPCFKNIQNLCNRTRSEVVKPNITVSNIHSQGMPWATKDFIFAFVRAINCWCILRGYLGCKDGNLGKIDREISPEFRACYSKWEKCTKQLTHYLIETFCKLDEANSPSFNANNNNQAQNIPGTSMTTSLITPNVKISSPIEENRKPLIMEPIQNIEKTVSNKEMAALKGIPGILHIPPASSVELGEGRNLTSDSTDTSPRDDDSENESRVYMKPGSYNVPTKQVSNQSNNTNSPRSLEFLETAQNVSVYQRKIAAEKPDSFAAEFLRDKVWQTAQNVTPEFIKQNEEASPSVPGNNADKLYEAIVTPQQNKHIENWLNNEKNRFDCRVLDIEEENEHQDVSSSVKARPNDPIISRCNSVASNELDIVSRSHRKCTELRLIPKAYSTFRRNLANAWEYKNGGLTDTAINILDRMLRELERDEFALQVQVKFAYAHSDDGEMKNPTSLTTIYKKMKGNKYMCINEIVHDFRHIIISAGEYLSDGKLQSQLVSFRDKIEDLIDHSFPSIDFAHITGESNEVLGSIATKQIGKSRKSADGDGDH